jgi:tRNA(adenine34) deaminase
MVLAMPWRWKWRGSAAQPLSAQSSRRDGATTATDLTMMRRCIELSRLSVSKGELPFGAIVSRDGETIVEAINRVAADNDGARHAEMVAMSEAQRALGRWQLRNCTLYTNVEPCVMCSWMIRENGIRRVVFSIKSPVMGGYSGWNVLGDTRLSSKLPVYFRRPPEVVSGVLVEEAERVWSEWRPFLWKLIKMRGCFGEDHLQEAAPPRTSDAVRTR